jgi:diguanylate cyclase (GGDEF)-like protein
MPPESLQRMLTCIGSGQLVTSDPYREIARLQAELARQRERVAELESLLEIDPLCEIPNRRGIARALRQAIAHSKRHDTAISLVLLDLDGFKAVNDCFGHSSGDRILRDVARLLVAGVRSSDFVGRLGGDEFVLILWHSRPSRASRRIATLCQRLAGVCETNNRIPCLGASFGVVRITPESQPAQLLAAADRLMYRDKASRRVKAPGLSSIFDLSNLADDSVCPGPVLPSGRPLLSDEGSSPGCPNLRDGPSQADGTS